MPVVVRVAVEQALPLAVLVEEVVLPRMRLEVMEPQTRVVVAEVALTDLD
jgi:hypothetical protein